MMLTLFAITSRVLHVESITRKCSTKKYYCIKKHLILLRRRQWEVQVSPREHVRAHVAMLGLTRASRTRVT
jgi:hypothetical protein